MIQIFVAGTGHADICQTLGAWSYVLLRVYIPTAIARVSRQQLADRSVLARMPTSVLRSRYESIMSRSKHMPRCTVQLSKRIPVTTLTRTNVPLAHTKVILSQLTNTP